MSSGPSNVTLFFRWLLFSFSQFHLEMMRPVQTIQTTGSGNILVGTAFVITELCVLMIIMALVKIYSANTDIAVILLFRYWFCLPGLLLLAGRRRGRDLFRVADAWILVYRCVFGFAGLATMYIALSLIEISRYVALNQSSALIITLLAPFMLAERVGIRRWVAVIAGFAGVLIILQPGMEGWFHRGVAFALLSPVLHAFMFIYLRKLGLSTPPETTALIYNVFGACLMSLYCLVSAPVIPAEPLTLLILVACGVLSSVQQVL
ncbi:MAG: DMT family transporter, partial [Rhodobacteraceae bacterium]|nr:DMT family transporter [Paracoccaceae bacterium]